MHAAAQTNQTDCVSIAIRNLSKTFPPATRALNDISLDIRPRQFITLLGPSGCGKSTLLRLIANLDTPTAGAIAITGQARTAFVFQDAHLLPWRNVLRNVAMPLELRHVAKSERLDAARSAIENVGLTDAIDRYPAQLSGGMRMRVSLARALVTNPNLLLLDEPFAALDEITRQRLDEQLLQLWASRGITVIFVTHSIPEATYLSQRVIVFSKRPGRIVLDHAIDLPTDRPAMIRGEPTFAKQTRTLYQALQQGEA